LDIIHDLKWDERQLDTSETTTYLSESDNKNQYDKQGKDVLGSGRWRDQSCDLVGHNGKEFLLVDFPISVEVKFIDHGLSAAGISEIASVKHVDTHSSSSSNRSPISFATRRKFRKLIFPVLSSSKSWNARRISSMGSRARIFSLTTRGGLEGQR
jgi:hypothetical protein